MDEPRYTAFVSHNTRDEELAGEVFRRLQQAEITTFLAQVELPKRPAGAVHQECERALSRSRTVLVCVGPHGIGPSQEEEISSAYPLEAEKKLEIIVVLLGNATRESIPEGYLQLRKKLAFVYPARPRKPGLREIVEHLAKVQAAAKGQQPRSTPSAPPVPGLAQDRDAEAGSLKLADSIGRYGLTVFVGSLWPEREEAAYFDPSEAAGHLLAEIGIEVGGGRLGELEALVERYPEAAAEIARLVRTQQRVMSFQRAAFCYTAAKELHRAGEKEAEDSIVKELATHLALRSPRIFHGLAELARRYRASAVDEIRKGGEATKRLVLSTSNVDRLLERTLIGAGIPFLQLVARPDGGFEHSLFETVRLLQDDCVRIETETVDEEGKARTVSHETAPYDPEREPEQAGLATAFRARRESLPDLEPEKIWRDLQIDNAVHEHVGAVQRAADGRETAVLITECVGRGIPILFKLFGSVDGSERGLAVNRMLQFCRNPGWVPDEMRTIFGQTASLFVGFSLADISFLHLYEYVLDEVFDGHSSQRRVLVCPSRIGPEDGPREVDRALMRLRHNVIDDRFKRIRAIDDEPVVFLDRLLARELFPEPVFW